MSGDAYCEITKYMDEHFDPEQVSTKMKDYFRTYILCRDGSPEIGFDTDGTYFWYVRVPGYTCANIRFNRNDTIREIVLTRRGGLFAIDHQETVYKNADELERKLNELFVGKKIEKLEYDE